MYYYRNLTPKQQNEVLEYRRQQRRPWHSPPHWNFEGERQFFISGSCYEHAHVIGANYERMTECENALLEVCENYASLVYASGRNGMWTRRVNLKNPLLLRVISNNRPMPFEVSCAPAQRETESV